MNLRQHPLSAAFPPMTGDELAALVEDIRDHGQRERIVLHDGMVLDGWHRAQACAVVGVEPRAIEYGGNDPAGYAISKNAMRRHLTASQRAVAVASCYEWAKAGRPPESAADRVSVAQMAREAKVSERTIHQAKAAIANGHAEPVRNGQMSVSAAARDGEPAPTKDTKAELEHLRASVKVLSQELESYARALEEGPRKEIEDLHQKLRVAESVRDDYMRQNAQLKREVKTLRGKQ